MEKIKFILSAIAGGYLSYVQYLGLSPEVLSILTVLVALDIITGVWASLVIDKRSIKSSIAFKGIIKKLGIIGVPFVLSLMFKGNGYDGKTFIDTVLGFIVVAEAYSTLSNYYSIRKGERVPEIDAISILFKYLSTQLEKVIGTKLASITIPGTDPQHKQPIEKKDSDIIL